MAVLQGVACLAEGAEEVVGDEDHAEKQDSFVAPAGQASDDGGSGSVFGAQGCNEFKTVTNPTGHRGLSGAGQGGVYWLLALSAVSGDSAGASLARLALAVLMGGTTASFWVGTGWAAGAAP